MASWLVRSKQTNGTMADESKNLIGRHAVLPEHWPRDDREVAPSKVEAPIGIMRAMGKSLSTTSMISP